MTLVGVPGPATRQPDEPDDGGQRQDGAQPDQLASIDPAAAHVRADRGVVAPARSGIGPSGRPAMRSRTRAASTAS